MLYLFELQERFPWNRWVLGYLPDIYFSRSRMASSYSDAQIQANSLVLSVSSRVSWHAFCKSKMFLRCRPV